MRRIITTIVLLAGLVLVPAASALLPGNNFYTTSLGSGIPRTRGFGIEKPSMVWLGGDETGEFTKLRWTHWGGGNAIGFGWGWYTPPGKYTYQSVQVITSLHAYDLGQCKGLPAYRKLSFYSKYNGRFHYDSTWSICGQLKMIGY